MKTIGFIISRKENELRRALIPTDLSKIKHINNLYFEKGYRIIHYTVDHTASLFWKTASESISKEIKKYIDDLVEGNYNNTLRNVTIIENGKILDEKDNKISESINTVFNSKITN